MMLELNQRAPMVLKTTCVDVDVMKDSGEETLNTLTCCFSGGGGVPELGLGEAEKLCIMTAWKRHMTLMFNAAKFEKSADNLQLMLYALAVIITSMAVYNTMDSNARAQTEALALANDPTLTA